MPGWGEAKGVSEEHVRRNEQKRAADNLARAVREYLARPTTGKQVTMKDALDRYDSLR